MKKLATLFVLGLFIMANSGCDDEDTTPQRKTKEDPYADVEQCNVHTYQAKCDVDENGQATRFYCEYSSDAGFSYVHTETCSEKCIEYKEHAQCVTSCSAETEPKSSCGTLLNDEISLRQVVVQESCKSFEDSLYQVKEYIDCDGICYNNQCMNIGDNCDAKTKDADTVLGCNGNDVYVCDSNYKIHKQNCPDEGFCQNIRHDGNMLYFCSSPCKTAKQKKSVCSIIGNYSIQTKCSKIDENVNYQFYNEDLNINYNDSTYCQDGTLQNPPNSTHCSGYCQDFCYGNIALPWWSKGGWNFIDCGVGKCDVKKHDISNGYVECMQPCDKEGEEITVSGAYLGYSKAESSTLECKRFDDGLYYSTVDVVDKK